MFKVMKKIFSMMMKSKLFIFGNLRKYCIFAV